jgi:hypothetical protein
VCVGVTQRADGQDCDEQRDNLRAIVDAVARVQVHSFPVTLILSLMSISFVHLIWLFFYVNV